MGSKREGTTDGRNLANVDVAVADLEVVVVDRRELGVLLDLRVLVLVVLVLAQGDLEHQLLLLGPGVNGLALRVLHGVLRLHYMQRGNTMKPKMRR